MKRRVSMALVCMMVIALLSVGVGVASATNGSASATVLYGVNSHDDGLSAINLATGAVSFIGDLDPDPNIYATPVAMAVHPSSGEIYVWNNSNIGESTGVLLTVDRCTGLATPVNPDAPNQGQMGALAFKSDGTLYGFGLESGTQGLYTIDTSTGIRSRVGPTSPATIPVFAGADFDAGGTLYGIELDGDHPGLFTINTADGTATQIATLDTDVGTWVGSIIFDGDGTLIGSAWGNDFDGDTYPDGILFDIDTANGTVSDIQVLPDGVSAPQGMGFASALCVAKELYWEHEPYPTYLPNPDYHFGDDDGVIEVGEKVRFIIRIWVKNHSFTETWSDIVLTDKLGADLDLWYVPGYGAYWPQVGGGSISHTTNRNGDQYRLKWQDFDVAPGGYAFMYVCVETDENPGGNQRYTETGIHYLNSGATAKGYVEGRKMSDSSNPIMVEVFEPD